MPPQPPPVLPLASLTHGQEADVFALLAGKEVLTTRDGKPYFRVTFRDARRQVSFPIWADSPWAEECKRTWQPGTFYKLRAVYRETAYGAQLDIRKIRPAVPADAADGFDPASLLPSSRYEAAGMFAELCQLAEAHISQEPLRRLVLGILHEHRARLYELPAAAHHHHAFVGGWLEHVLSVTHTCILLAEKYARLYPDLVPPLDKGLVVAGAVLHDIGKLRELAWQGDSAVYTAEGSLIGHVVLGRDMVRDAAMRQAQAGHPLDAETLLRLEHLILAHQRLPEWGSPKPPMTPEALLVHYADDLDAKYAMLYTALREDSTPGPVTSRKNPLGQSFYRGSPPREETA
jgi:3'-5' exoribonuclease